MKRSDSLKQVSNYYDLKNNALVILSLRMIGVVYFINILCRCKAAEWSIIMIKKITDYFNKIGNKGVCIAFSGGVDSTVLLKLAALSGIKVIAVTFDTYLHPISDLQLSKDTAKEFGVEHYVIKVNELENHNVYSNPPDRCYHCKHILFSNLKDFARSKDIDVIIDGTNFDDLSEYRPGLKALAEFNVKSPLAELKITKNQVREIAEDLNLKVSKKPSSPCLATRLPYNTPIKPEYINMISLSEDYLKSKALKMLEYAVMIL